MPGDVDVDPLPTSTIFKKRLQCIDHMAVVEIASVQHQDRSAFAEYFIVDRTFRELVFHLAHSIGFGVGGEGDGLKTD